MRITTSPEQRKFYEINGFLELEALLTSQEMEKVESVIEQVIASCSPMEIRKYDNLFRSAPYLLEVLNKKGLAALCGELNAKKPLYLSYDRALHEFPFSPLEENELGVLLCPNGHVIFFKETFPHTLFKPKEQWHLLFVLTSNHRAIERHPQVYR